MAADFKSLLRKPIDSVVKPKALPAGTYRGRVKTFEFKESKEKKTPFVQFNVQVVSATDEVEPDSLAGIDLSKKLLRKDYYITDDALWRLREFIESVTGPIPSGSTLDEYLPQTLHADVLVAVTQRLAQDGSGDIFNDVSRMSGPVAKGQD